MLILIVKLKNKEKINLKKIILLKLNKILKKIVKLIKR